MTRAAEKLSFHAEPSPERGETLLTLEMGSDLNGKYPTISRIVQTLRAGWTLTPAEEKRIQLCLDEAIQNAVVWGNKQDPSKKVRLRVFREGESWGLTVSDEGEGFGPESLPDYESEDFLWQDHGRGVFIMLHYLSEVAYYNGGRTLFLRS